MNIGITGIANGGKTVFLTSLLWQLAERESAEFVVSPNAEFSGYKPLDINTGSLFPFEKYRDTLIRGGRWPEKTTDSYRFRCEIRRKNWKKISLSTIKRFKRLQFTNRQELSFFDFPGERIADAAIAAFESYENWSDHILKHFHSHSDYLATVKPYLAELKEVIDSEMTVDKMEKELAYSYKLALAGLIHGFKPLISPSTFLLTRDGDVAEAVPEEELATKRYSGLNFESQFFPLPAEYREKNPALLKRVIKNYKQYRDKLANPLFKEIVSARRLVILVDIPSFLAGGVGRYNDNRQIMLDLFESIEADGLLGELLQKLWSFVGLGLEKVAFVATKSDLMLSSDIISGKVEGLLRQMTARAKSTLPDIEFGYFVCSAVHSTRPGTTASSLIGNLGQSEGSSEVEFNVSSLPEVWPDSWSPGEYRFAEVLPKVSKNLMIPPKQVGLDRLFEFLITEKG